MLRKGWLSWLVTCTLLAGSLVAGVLPPAGAQPSPPTEMEAFWLNTYATPLGDSLATMDRELLAKAQPDECYNGLGAPYVADPTCPGWPDGQPKVNEGYVFGLTKAGDDLWYGTVTNMPCLVLSQILGLVPPHETGAWACEFGLSAYGQNYGLPSILGDWRPPSIYRYHLPTRTQIKVTPADPLIADTLGLRSAGTLGDVVLLAGPSLAAWAGTGGGLNFFAFHTDGTYLGSAVLPEYNDIRKWVVHEGVLYTGVRNSAGGGSVLRWLGDAGNPFAFEVVGHLDAAAADLAVHQGQLFVTTWPDLNPPNLPTVLSGLWMSPPIPPGGLDAGHSPLWQKVWQADDYEADPLVAHTYMGGGLASYGGYLYWGTMHFPTLGAIGHLLTYGVPEDPEDVLAVLLATHRPINIFRGTDFGTPGEVQQVLYGLPWMPAYDPATGEWVVVPNGMEPPRLGLAGFGNMANTYTWTMAAYDGELMVGTFDWSFLLTQAPDLISAILGAPLPQRDLYLPLPVYGADLWRFPDPEGWALPESIMGVGNYTNYGIRTMLSDDALYLGTANPMNLLTDPADVVPEGGWEVLRLTREPGQGDGIDLNLKVPVTADLFAPCTNDGDGEVVHLEGNVHIRLRVDLNRRARVHAHVNPQGLRGIGTITGMPYHATGASNLVLTTRGMPAEATGVLNFHLISPHPGTNLMIHGNLHLWLDAGGQVRVAVENLTLECR